MKTQKIEIYIGWTDGTWHTTIIDMPENTPHIGDFIEQEAMKIGVNSDGEVAFADLYNECPIGEEEESKEDGPFFFVGLVEYRDPFSKERRCHRYIIEATTMTEATKKLEDFTPTYYTLQMKPIIKTGTGYVDNNGKPVTNISRILLRK